MDEPEADVSDVTIVTRTRDRRGATHRAPHTAHALSIAHLLLWTGCCALFIALTRDLAAHQPGSLGGILLILLAIGNGTAGAGLVITLTRSIRGVPWPIEPGQWLLAILGAAAVVEMLAEGTSGTWVKHPRGIIEAVAACAFAVPLFSKRLTSRWKWFFGAVSMLHAFPLLVAVFDVHYRLAQSLVDFTWSRLAAATAFGAVALTVSERIWPVALADGGARQRGWLHWAGIATAIWLAALFYIAPTLLAAFV